MSAALERHKLEDAREEVKRILKESSSVQRESGARADYLEEELGKLSSNLDRQCEEPIRLNLKHLKVGWDRAEKQGFLRGMFTMALIWMAVGMVVTCLGGCFADAGSPVGSTGDDSAAVTSTDTSGASSTDTSASETGEGTDTTGDLTTTGADTSADTSETSSGMETGPTTGPAENPYTPCPCTGEQSDWFCSPYNDHSVCTPYCNPEVCPEVEGWETYCEGIVCRIRCTVMTGCPDGMICTAFIADEGKCFYP
jgi:hypothetical protein